MRIRIEWELSHLLFQSTYNHYDEIAKFHNQQMRDEILSLNEKIRMLGKIQMLTPPPSPNVVGQSRTPSRSPPSDRKRSHLAVPKIAMTHQLSLDETVIPLQSTANSPNPRPKSPLIKSNSQVGVQPKPAFKRGMTLGNNCSYSQGRLIRGSHHKSASSLTGEEGIAAVQEALLANASGTTIVFCSLVTFYCFYTTTT